MAGSSDAQALLLQVSADTSKALKQLDELSKKLSGVAGDAEKASKRASTSLEKFFGKTDPAKALDKVFDSTRFRVLDSGVAKVGIFGSALESLGPAGLAAAAGVGAVAAAFAGARQAAAFADDISDTANRLHVTTDALQEYRFAIHATGGESADADAALEGFSQTLGKAQEGLAKGQKAFLALGFTKDQIKGFKDADDALKAVTERIAHLPSAQQDAVIQQLGLDGLKPLIAEGADEMARLREEAHKVGIVMDAELVKRGGEMNDQFETVSKVIDVQLKSALIDLSPIILDLLGLMARMARAAADVADAFRTVQNRTTAGLERQLAELKAQRAGHTGLATRALDVAAGTVPFVGPAILGARLASRNPKARDAQISRIEAELAQRKKDDATPPPTRTLLDLSDKAGKSPKGSTPHEQRDTSVQRTAEVDRQVEGAERDLLSAWLQLVHGADQRADLQKDLIDIEQKQLGDQITKQQADIQADKGLSDAKKTELVASLEKVRLRQQDVADLQKELIDRERDETKRKEAQDIAEAGVEAQSDVLRSQEALAETAKQRREIELRLLDLADQREKVELEGILASKTATEAEKAIAKQKLETLNSTRPAREEDVRRNTAGPAEQFRLDNSAERFNENAERFVVQGLDNLSTGLADAIVNARSLGDVAKNVFRQMVADLLAAAIKKDIVAPLLAFIPGFASGTNSAPGGLALVGERGPELVNLPKGSKVTPSHQTLQALQSMQIPKAASPIIVQQSLMFDNRGAVMTDDLLRQMNAMAAGAQQRAVAQSLALGKKQLPDVLRSQQMLRG